MPSTNARGTTSRLMILHTVHIYDGYDVRVGGQKIFVDSMGLKEVKTSPIFQSRFTSHRIEQNSPGPDLSLLSTNRDNSENQQQ